MSKFNDDQIDKMVNRMFLLGPGEAMRQDEREKGYGIILPGEVPWLPTEDWPDNVVISQCRDEIRIIAIFAKEPGKGAFRRMIAGIKAAGLKPVVVCPFRDMEDILVRWHWNYRGNEEWTP